MKLDIGSLDYLFYFQGKFRPYHYDQAGKAETYQCMTCRNIVGIAFPGGYCYCCGTKFTEQMRVRPKDCPRQVWDRYGDQWHEHYAPPYAQQGRWKINVKGFSIQTRVLERDEGNDGRITERHGWHGTGIQFVSNERFSYGYSQAAHCLKVLQCDPLLSPDRQCHYTQRQYRYVYIFRFIDDGLGIHKETVLQAGRPFVRTPDGEVWQVSHDSSPTLGMST